MSRRPGICCTRREDGQGGRTLCQRRVDSCARFVELRRKRFDRPHEVRSVDKARIERAQIERFGGREVKTKGGRLPPPPVSQPGACGAGCAAMIETATAYGLTARAAVHAGEVELRLRVTRCGGSRFMPRHAVRLRAGICRPGRVSTTRPRWAPQSGGAGPLGTACNSLATGYHW